MGRGGDRSAAALANGKTMGRPKNVPDVGLDPKLSKGFASRVFARIKELKLQATGPDGKSEVEIKGPEDYALEILRPQDAAARSFFQLLLAYQLGKPVQPVIAADTRETARDLDFGDLPNITAGEPGAVGKPN